jgi:hypothetical protein
MLALGHMRRHDVVAIDVRSGAQAAWNEQVQRKMRGTVWQAGGCASWYLDQNSLNTSLWPNFSFRFRRALRWFDADSYRAWPAMPRRESEPAAPLTVPA